MTRILIRECVNIQRRQRRAVPMETLPERPQEDSPARALEEALETLPQRARTMVVLYYLEGYTVKETAQIMGATKGAVCAGLSRARSSLRALLEEE